MTMGFKEWALLIGLSVIWGGSFFFNEIALLELKPLTLVWLRVTIAAAVLWCIVVAKKSVLPRQPLFWCSILLMGLMNNALPFTLIVWGQQSISSGLASILNATMPLFTVVVAGIFLPDERFSALRVSGVLIGLGGVALMIGTEHLQHASGNVVAQIAILGAAFSYAISSAFGRRVKLTSNAPLLAAAGQVTAASLWLLPLVLLKQDLSVVQDLSAKSVISVLALGIVCTAFAYVAYFSLLTSSGATNLSLVTFLVPVSAILLGWAFLGESLKLIHYLGMACIGLGLAAIDGRPVRALKRTLLSRT